jgi:hypothetical protein
MNRSVFVVSALLALILVPSVASAELRHVQIPVLGMD